MNEKLMEAIERTGRMTAEEIASEAGVELQSSRFFYLDADGKICSTIMRDRSATPVDSAFDLGYLWKASWGGKREGSGRHQETLKIRNGMKFRFRDANEGGWKTYNVRINDKGQIVLFRDDAEKFILEVAE